MALDTTRLAAELDAMIADLPAEVTFGSVTFDAAMTMATIGSDIAEGGFMPSRDVGLHAKTTSTTKTVKVGSKLSVALAGVITIYRVTQIERSHDGQELIFSCQSHRR
jgi:hypothetical protein